MVFALAVLSLLSASAPGPSVAVTHFRFVQASAELGGFVEDRFAQQLNRRGLQVSTASDLEAVLGMERQRQLLGCSDDTACLAELSSALGVPYVAVGRLTKLGTRLELDVRVVRQADARVVALDTRGTNDESALAKLVEDAANAIADQLLPKPTAKPASLRLWVPVGLGAASLLAGAALVTWAQLDYAAWTTKGGSVGVLSGEAITAQVQSLNVRQGLGFGLVGVGAAAIIFGAVWHAVTPDAPAVSLLTTRDAVLLSWGGRF